MPFYAWKEVQIQIKIFNVVLVRNSCIINKSKTRRPQLLHILENAITETSPLICQRVKIGLKKNVREQEQNTSITSQAQKRREKTLNSILDISKDPLLIRIDKSIMQIPFISIIITHEFEISKAAPPAWCPKAFSRVRGVLAISISGDI